MTAVLLVFQYGQPRIFFAMARDGLLPRVGGASAAQDAHAARHHDAHRRCSWRSWALIGDAGETYDLTNIGTLFAFALVCIGVLVLRVHRARPPAAVPRAVRLARVHSSAPAACVFVMRGLPRQRVGAVRHLAG